jgi:hypothetical protein
MNDLKSRSVMSREIFQLGLAVETTSLYILCCGLADDQSTISTKNIRNIWNGTDEALSRGLVELEEKNILRKVLSDRQENCIYQLVASDKWRA